MVHQGSTTVLLWLAISMVPLLVGAAVTVSQFESKDEALAYCNNIQGSKDDHFSVYPGKQADVFYSCSDKSETQSDFKSGAPCKSVGWEGASPAISAFYVCGDDHHIRLLLNFNGHLAGP